MMDWIYKVLNVTTPLELTWVVIGLFGQVMFFGRWIVQWIASEKARRSVVPIAFWYLSFVGGLIVLAYGLYRHEPVIIAGQAPGAIIYGRNIWLVYRERYRRKQGYAPGATTQQHGASDD